MLPSFTAVFSLQPVVLPAGVFEQLGVELLLYTGAFLPQVQRRQRDVSAVRVQHETRVPRAQQLHRVRERRDETRNRRGDSAGSSRDISTRYLRYRRHIRGVWDGFRSSVLLGPVRHAVHMRRSTWCARSLVCMRNVRSDARPLAERRRTTHRKIK